MLAHKGFVYVRWGKTEASSNLTEKEKIVFLEDFKSDRGSSYNPVDFSFFKEDLKSIGGYRIMLCLALGLTIASLTIMRGNRNIRWLATVASTCFIINFFISELEFLFGRGDGITIFTPLVRNDKWIYFFSFLIVVAGYPSSREKLKKHPFRYSRPVFNCAYLAIFLICLSGPLYASTYHNYLGMKISAKLGLCQFGGEEELGQILWRFCPDEVSFDILKVNNDVDEVTSFMRNMEEKGTFVGPAWLRYKAQRNLVSNKEDGTYYLRVRDRKYLEWKESNRIYNQLVEKWLYRRAEKEWLEEARKINADFLFFEKNNFVFQSMFLD